MNLCSSENRFVLIIVKRSKNTVFVTLFVIVIVSLIVNTINFPFQNLKINIQSLNILSIA